MRDPVERPSSRGLPGTARNVLASIYELPGGAARVLPMEGLRGLAVLLVFFVHVDALYHREGSIVFAVTHFLGVIGHAGVDVFFVLSGYLIYGAIIRRRVNFVAFMRRRIQRIYPTFLAMLAVYLVLSLVFPEKSRLPDQLWAALLYIGQNAALMPGLFPIEAIITVAWSLSYEIFFYLTMPVLVAVLRMRDWTSRARSLFFLAIGVGFACLNLTVSTWCPRLLLFIPGILMYEAVTHGSAGKSATRPRELLALLGVMAGLAVIYYVKVYIDYVPGRSQTTHAVITVGRAVLLALTLYPLVLYSLVGRGLLARVFSWTPLRWLGNMSYSYYLSHSLALQGLTLVLDRLFGAHVPPPLLLWPLVAAAFLGTLALSTVLFVSVEKPLSLRPRRQPAPGPGRVNTSPQSPQAGRQSSADHKE